MSEKIWLAELTAEQLSGWLVAPRAQTPFAVLERIDCIDFPASDEIIDLTLWTQGRIFGSALELRWERRDQDFNVRLMGELSSVLPEPFGLWAEAGELLEKDSWCYVWGEAEGRIGRRLDYRAMPPGSGRPCLLRREAWSGGKLVATRLVEMKMEVES